MCFLTHGCCLLLTVFLISSTLTCPGRSRGWQTSEGVQSRRTCWGPWGLSFQINQFSKGNCFLQVCQSYGCSLHWTDKWVKIDNKNAPLLIRPFRTNKTDPNKNLCSKSRCQTGSFRLNSVRLEDKMVNSGTHSWQRLGTNYFWDLF